MTQNKKRKYYKFLSIIISFVMIFTALPLIPVFADIEEGIETINSEVLSTPESINPSEEEIGGEYDANVAGPVIDPSLPRPAELEDGVYAIKNLGNSRTTYSLYMDTQYAQWLPGYHMQQYKFTGTATPCSDFEVSALFKLTKVGNAYVIRILRNCLLSFTINEKSDGGYEFLTVEIPLNDNDVPLNNRFYIVETSQGSNQYVIQQAGTDRYVSANSTDASGSAGAPNSYLCGGTSMSGTSLWGFVKYEGVVKESVSLLGSGSLVAGEEKELYPVFYSTRPGYNQLSLDIQSPSSESCLIDDSSPYGKIRITPYTDEDIVVDIKAGNGTDSYTIDTQTWSVGVPFEEGIYFFKNVRYSNKYVQINNIDNMDQDTIIELHNFHGYYEQRWNVEHVWNQYYKIISTHSDKALTAPTGANNDVVTQTDYTGELTQRWKFIEQSDGTYKISPASNSNYFMAAGDISSTADQDLEIRTAQSDGGDRWIIRDLMYSFSVGGEFYEGEDVTDAAESWKQCGYISSYNINPQLSDLSDSNLNSQIVYFSSHGSQHRLALLNGIYLTDGIHMTSAPSAQISNYSLSDSKLYIYDACKTASNADGSGYNLCTQTLASGAECVIGWAESIDAEDARNWQSRFQDRLIYGYSVLNAANYANTFSYNSNATIKSWRIYGNGNLAVNEYNVDNELDETLSATNISYSQHSSQAITTILKNNYPDFSDDAASIEITYTDNNQSNYVVDYYYLYNGFITSSGYSIIIQNGIITQIRDNTTTSTNGQMLYSLASIAPTITQDVIDNAVEKANLELRAIDLNYDVSEQYGEGYYHIANGRYYYRVMTVYVTPDNTYGAFYTYYEI